MTIEEMIIGMIWFTVILVIQGTVIVFMVWLLRKKQVFSLIKFALRGGSLVLKAYPDNTIEILQTKQALNHVEWNTKDKLTGKGKTNHTFITKVEHTLKGTSYPIHFCPSTFPTSINILTKEKAQLNQEELNALMAMEYNQGVTDTMLTGKVGGFPIDKATLFLLFIIGAMILVCLVFNWQILDALAAKGF